MKKIFLMAILATGMVAFAQEAKGHSDDAERIERIERRMTKLTTELDLNEKQQVELKNLLEEQLAKRDAKMAEIKKRKDNTPPTDAERAAMKKEREVAQKDFQVKLEKILTKEQLKKWEASTKKREDALKTRRARRQ